MIQRAAVSVKVICLQTEDSEQNGKHIYIYKVRNYILPQIIFYFVLIKVY